MRFFHFDFRANLLFAALGLIGSPGGILAEDGPEVSSESAVSAEDLEFFETRIRPVLVKHCYECHSTDAETIRGGLRLDQRDALLRGGDSGPGLVPRKPEDSLLLDAMRYDGLEMPPDGRLPDRIVADFETWIKRGAADPRVGISSVTSQEIDYRTAGEFWAFQMPVRRNPPQSPDPAWNASLIDRFVHDRLARAGLSPSPPAEPHRLARRLWIDLTGLPPKPSELSSFLATDDDAQRRALIDRLMATPQFGERWARMWLDVARYGEDQAHTFKARRYPRGYLYRDWVVDAFNRDLPYDTFLATQIAGDLNGSELRLHERVAALGLFALGPVYYQDNGEKDKALADEWDDRVDTLIRGTQAMTIACARCHDHKFDPLSMEDYYGLAGIFRSSEYRERPAVPEAVVKQRADADARVKDCEKSRSEFLNRTARSLRPQLIAQIPSYVEAAWQTIQQERNGKKRDDAVKEVLKIRKKDDPSLQSELLKRWIGFLENRVSDYEEAWISAGSKRWVDRISSTKSAPADRTAPEEITAYARKLRDHVKSVAERRDTLFGVYGDALAFVKASDLTEVPAGTIPLGNLFDDEPVTQLASALRTDPFKSTAQPGRLGVAHVAHGWGDTVSIADGIRFQFGSLGSDNRTYGSVTNDGWHTIGGIRTQGSKASPDLPKTEQGIGIHANGLVTFDLAQIRRAGDLPENSSMTFCVDRAGINDDVFGNDCGVHLAVIVSRPHRKPNVFDAILSVHVDGKQVPVEENDQVYYLPNPPGKPLRADGHFVSFRIEVPAEARYLTLVSAGAARADEANSINSDHGVFSGARLEYPAPESIQVAGPSTENLPTDSEEMRRQATLLSEFFHDRGLLAVSPKASVSWFNEQQKEDLGKWDQQLTELKADADSIKVVMAHSLTDGQGADMPLYRAGDPAKKGEPVPRSFPRILTGGQRVPFESSGSGRRELAAAITSSQNPLTARVIVNRLWQSYFGQGLVRTTSNFGQLGDRPSHPELLDFLALELMENGWSLKHIHRLIVNSQTYRQSSRYRETGFQSDPENRLLWRMNRRRLQVEPWRDSLLAVAGTLDQTMGGPSVDLGKSSNNRRTLYGSISRHQLNDLLRLFDFPDPNITSGVRSVTTVPLQQLFVLNSEFMNRQARALANRVNREAGTDEQRIQLLFELLYCRSPDASERQFILEFLLAENQETSSELTAWERLSLAMLGSNEFCFLD